MNATAEHLRSLSMFFDDSNAHRDPESVTLGRIAKIAEEHGEAVAAFLGAIGENPRKGITHSIDDVIKELLDVAVTALGAAEHLADHDGETMNRLDSHITYLAARVGLI